MVKYIMLLAIIYLQIIVIVIITRHINRIITEILCFTKQITSYRFSA